MLSAGSDSFTLPKNTGCAWWYKTLLSAPKGTNSTSNVYKRSDPWAAKKGSVETQDKCTVCEQTYGSLKKCGYTTKAMPIIITKQCIAALKDTGHYAKYWYVYIVPPKWDSLIGRSTVCSVIVNDCFNHVITDVALSFLHRTVANIYFVVYWVAYCHSCPILLRLNEHVWYTLCI